MWRGSGVEDFASTDLSACSSFMGDPVLKRGILAFETLTNLSDCGLIDCFGYGVEE